MKDKPVREDKDLDKELKHSVEKSACCISKGGDSSNTVSLPNPLSPYLQVIYKMQITSLLSISHRASGIFLFFGTLFFSWYFILYAFFTDFVIASFSHQYFILASKVFTFLFLSSFTYHFFNGIRHLLWDLGVNLTNKEVSATGVIVIILFLFSTFSLAFLTFL